ncbi:hypothetical protein B0H10DRAFT_1965887 [Mycena sp. CBHHK59/15]|nr:hypothetical protein B0H10DRAFT_1965887 [Mycena sp. CBHHK59/15]
MCRASLDLQQRISELEEENGRLRQALNLPPANRPPTGTGPTGRDMPKFPVAAALSSALEEEVEKNPGLRSLIGIKNSGVSLRVVKSGFDESQNPAANVGPAYPAWLDPSLRCSGGDQLIMETHIDPPGNEPTMTVSRNIGLTGCR